MIGTMYSPFSLTFYAGSANENVVSPGVSYSDPLKNFSNSHCVL